MQNQDNNMIPRSVGDLDINVWITRYERNRNIVPAGLPRFFLGHIVAQRAEIHRLQSELTKAKTKKAPAKKTEPKDKD